MTSDEPRMTLDEFRERIKAARVAGDRDPEVSHYYSDQACEDALRSIHADPEDADALAKVTLAVELLDASREWARWYA